MTRFMRMNKKGIALVLAYFAIVVLSILVVAVTQRARTELVAAQRNMLSTKALYLAEGGVEEATKTLGQKIANFEDEPVAADDTFFSGSETGYLSTDFNLSYSCKVKEAEGAEQEITDSLGIVTKVRHYEITATATHSQYGLSETISQIVKRKKTYTFQHAVFYNDDLEMIPGVDMTLSGKVHSNDDIYIAANGSSTIFTIDSKYLYSVGNIYNKRKNNDARMPGTVNIQIKGQPSGTYENMYDGSTYYDSDYSNWTDESQTRWGYPSANKDGTAKSSVHGVTALAVPEVGSIQPDGYYAGQAESGGLKITKKSDGSWEIYVGGSEISRSDFAVDPISESSFQDKREETTVTVADIDISKLNQAEEIIGDQSEGVEGHGVYEPSKGETYTDSNGNSQYDPSYFPNNGLMYVTREDSSVSQPNGVRLVNGEELNGKLTAVSNNPVYIKGDYNTTSKKGSAVICDAVNILSNSWNDSNDNFSDRNATDTTVNTAFISGIVPTPDGGGNYSGGLENYPRLHENWQSDGRKTLTIGGSFVVLWYSSIADGLWHYGSPDYTAPNRAWDYDTDFNDSNNLPVFTPFAVEAERVVWWKS